jgi:hypothetical protein
MRPVRMPDARQGDAVAARKSATQTETDSADEARSSALLSQHKTRRKWRVHPKMCESLQTIKFLVFFAPLMT